ncbi:hypothetical protein AC578_2028 [Pseudocercospora eumusae]|uniref:Uncharacterized protein n=1 Tax=Pseudocercospora eumusae TaxID=321146 RepID=A0A139HHB8_9PEZI|nr:hypothetical protein AC578_2028 [Pseudocercospora eumusae]
MASKFVEILDIDNTPYSRSNPSQRKRQAILAVFLGLQPVYPASQCDQNETKKTLSEEGLKEEIMCKSPAISNNTTAIMITNNIHAYEPLTSESGLRLTPFRRATQIHMFRGSIDRSRQTIRQLQ